MPTGCACRTAPRPRRWWPPWPAGWPSAHLALGDLRTGQSLEEAYLAITGARAEPDCAGAASPAGRGRGRRGRAPALMRPLTAQLRAEVTMIFTNGETLFLTLGIPVVFLLFFTRRARAAHRHAASGRLPGARHPGAGRHVDVDDRPVHRHRLRARLRRPQAPRVDAARTAPAAGGQDPGRPGRRGPPGRRAGGRRLRCWAGTPAGRAGPAPWSARHWWPWCSAPWPSAGWA